jgi:hypothetical protein
LLDPGALLRREDGWMTQKIRFEERHVEKRERCTKRTQCDPFICSGDAQFAKFVFNMLTLGQKLPGEAAQSKEAAKPSMSDDLSTCFEISFENVIVCMLNSNLPSWQGASLGRSRFV